MKVTRYTHVDKGNLVGFCSVVIEPMNMFINDIGIYRKNDQKWANFPSRKYDTEEGTKYAPYIGFLDKETKESFQKQLFEALDAYRKQNDAAQAKQNDPELPF